MILVDTNVLVDVVTDDPLWAEWSERQLTLAAARDDLAINDIVYAELSVRYTTNRGTRRDDPRGKPCQRSDPTLRPIPRR